MKMHFEISIDARLDTVWAALNNPNNMERWQQNFRSYTYISGDSGQVRSVSELRYNEKGEDIVLTETITEVRDGNFLAANYQSMRGRTTVVNRFGKIDVDKANWASWRNFIYTGFARLISPFVSGGIRKRMDGDLQRCKLMVETDEAGEAR
jgi:hypothetical protein